MSFAASAVLHVPTSWPAASSFPQAVDEGETVAAGHPLASSFPLLSPSPLPSTAAASPLDETVPAGVATRSSADSDLQKALRLSQEEEAKKSSTAFDEALKNFDAALGTVAAVAALGNVAATHMEDGEEKENEEKKGGEVVGTVPGDHMAEEESTAAKSTQSGAAAPNPSATTGGELKTRSKKSELEYQKQLHLSKVNADNLKRISNLFKMDTTNIDLAAISQMKAVVQSTNGLLYPGDDMFSVEHPGREVIGVDEFYPHNYSKPQLVWIAASNDSRKTEQADYAAATPVLYPHFKFPVQPDMKCVVHSILLSLRPDLLTENPRDARDGMNSASDKSDVDAFYKEVGEFVIDALSEGVEGAKYKAVKSALALHDDETAWYEMAQRLSKVGTAQGDDFAKAVSIMANAWVQEVRYVSTGPTQQNLFGAGLHSDALGGLLRSDHTLQSHPTGESIPDLFPFDVSTSPMCKLSYVLSFSDPSSLRDASKIGHGEALFPAPDLLLSTLNHPLCKLEPSAWIPVQYGRHMSFFLTPYHQFTNKGERFHIRSGSCVLVTPPSAPACDMLYNEGASASSSFAPYLRVIVVSTFVKLSSTFVAESIERTNNESTDAIDDEIKEQAERSIAEYKELIKMIPKMADKKPRPKAPVGFFTALTLPSTVDHKSMQAIREYINSLNEVGLEDSMMQPYMIDDVIEVEFPKVDVSNERKVFSPTTEKDSRNMIEYAIPVGMPTTIPTSYSFSDPFFVCTLRRMRTLGLPALSAGLTVEDEFTKFIEFVVEQAKVDVFPVDKLMQLKKVWQAGVNFGDDDGSSAPLCLHKCIESIYFSVVGSVAARRAQAADKKTTTAVATPEAAAAPTVSFVRPAVEDVLRTKTAMIFYGDYFSPPEGPGTVTWTDPEDPSSALEMESAVLTFIDQLGSNSANDSQTVNALQEQMLGPHIPLEGDFWYLMYKRCKSYFEEHHPRSAGRGYSWKNIRTYQSKMKKYIALVDPQLFLLTHLSESIDQSMLADIVADNLDGWRDLHPYCLVPSPSAEFMQVYKSSKVTPTKGKAKEKEAKARKKEAKVREKEAAKARAKEEAKEEAKVREKETKDNQAKSTKTNLRVRLGDGEDENVDGVDSGILSTPQDSNRLKRKLSPESASSGDNRKRKNQPIATESDSLKGGKKRGSDSSSEESDNQERKKAKPNSPPPSDPMLAQMMKKMEESNKRADEQRKQTEALMKKMEDSTLRAERTAKEVAERAVKAAEKANTAAATLQQKMELEIAQLKRSLEEKDKAAAAAAAEAAAATRPPPPPHHPSPAPHSSSNQTQAERFMQTIFDAVGQAQAGSTSSSSTPSNYSSGSSSSSSSMPSSMSTMMNQMHPPPHMNMLFGLNLAHLQAKPYIEQAARHAEQAMSNIREYNAQQQAQATFANFLPAAHNYQTYGFR